jgi:iron(III) transport system substrate-binding protein
MREKPDYSRHAMNRRAFLQRAAVGAGGLLLAACQPQTPPAAAPAAVSAAPSMGAEAGHPAWQAAWDALVAGAKREGVLILHGPPTPETRQQVPAAFTQRFGIPVEYIALRSSELAPKMVAEKQAGLVTIDAMITGFNSWADVLYPAGLVADLKSQLILPEVTDESLWITDPPLFVDPEQSKLMRLFNSTPPMLVANRDYVDPSTIRVAQDLLRPELRGRIVTDDPLVAGTGSVPPAYFLKLFGEEFVRKLYGEQVVSSRDPRQVTDQLARGQCPIGLAIGGSGVQALIDDGFPIELIVLADAPGFTGGGFGISGIIEGAPHPNASRLFGNWIASREGLTVYARSLAEVGTRKDINYHEWAPDFMFPKPGLNYLASYNWEFKTKEQPAAQQRLRDLLGR